jgi:hypothetical protein
LPLRGPLARLVGLLTLGRGIVEPLRVLATILRQDSNTSATPRVCTPRKPVKQRPTRTTIIEGRWELGLVVKTQGGVKRC